MVREKDILRLEKLNAEQNQTVKIDRVLLASNDKETKIGTPYIPGASVEVKVLKTSRAEKIIVFKMKAKKRYKKKQGHRQAFSEVEVLKITA